jgi:hypothetical protein
LHDVDALRRVFPLETTDSTLRLTATMAKLKKQYYAVHAPYTEAAIYKTWNYAEQFCCREGGRSNPVFQGFLTYEEALYFYHTGRETHNPADWKNLERVPFQGPSSQPTNNQRAPPAQVMQHLPPVTNGRPGQNLDDVPEDGLSKYYAVARGTKIGLFQAYCGENGSQKQTDGVSGAKHNSFDDRDDAIDYLVQNDIPRSEIRLYGLAFRKQPGFEPDSTASFND